MKAKLLSSVITGCFVVVGTAGATSLVAVGCGGDDSGTGPSADAGLDQSTDSPVGDATPDHSQTDSAPGSETGTDAGLDSGDSATEADVADTSTPDAPTASGYVAAVSLAYCQRLESCCELDAGTFSMDQCVAGLYGDPVGTGEATPYLDSGLVAYNSVEALQCLSDLANFPCGTVSATQTIMLRQNCAGAFTGTQTTGGACLDSVECTSTDYCLVPGDGGVGACTPLVGDGGACTHPFGNECSYLSLGVPSLYCDSVTLTCMPEQPNGSDCTSFIACQSQICEGTTPTCSATYVFSDPGAPSGRCASVTAVPDAGGD